MSVFIISLDLISGAIIGFLGRTQPHPVTPFRSLNSFALSLIALLEQPIVLSLEFIGFSSLIADIQKQNLAASVGFNSESRVQQGGHSML